MSDAHGPGSTHWPGCWREHPSCARAWVEDGAKLIRVLANDDTLAVSPEVRRSARSWLWHVEFQADG